MDRRPGEALDNQFARLSVVLENAPVILYGLDPEGRFTFSEGNGLAAAGLRAGQATGTLAADLYRETPAALEAIRGALKGKHTVFEAHFHGADFVSRLTPVFDDTGALREVVGVSLDVSRQMQAEHALDEREEQLRQSQKMEAVGQLAGGIAHDFNNLLTAIIGYGDLILAMDERPLSSVRGDLEKIKLAAEGAASLTRQILAFSRRQTLQPTATSLNDLLAETEPLLRRTMGDHIELDLVLEPELGLIEVDAQQLVQVVLNLAINARDAMKLGGRLKLETTNIELDEQFCRAHVGTTPGPHVMLAVSDTGEGMDQDTMSRIFEPFFTTKGPGEGTGLGLSTVYGIVRQSGGSISVESDLGRGTTFRVYFSRLELLSTKALPIVVDPPAVVVAQEAILVVEDEPEVLAIMSRVLTQEGYLVFAATDGAQALALIEDEDRSIDLLVTDVRLPHGLQGDVLAQRVRALRAGLPVLFVSGYPYEALTQGEGVSTGVDFLQKPFTPNSLSHKVRDALDSATG